MLHVLRAEADRTAQAALHKLVVHRERTGRWDPKLAAEYHVAEQLLDLIDDRLRDMLADTTEAYQSDNPPLGEPPTADPGDHFAGMPA